MALSTSKALVKIRRRLMDLQETNYSNDELLDYLNEGVRVVMQHMALTWPEYYLRSSSTQLQTTNIASGTASYALPTNFWIPIVVSVTDSAGDTTEYDALSIERTLDPDAEGYYLRNDKTYLYPTPTASVTSGLNIYYIPVPTDTSTTLPMGDDLGDAYIAWAVMRGKLRQGENTGGEAEIWKLCDQRAQLLGLRVNSPDGPKVLARQWI